MIIKQKNYCSDHFDVLSNYRGEEGRFKNFENPKSQKIHVGSKSNHVGNSEKFLSQKIMSGVLLLKSLNHRKFMLEIHRVHPQVKAKAKR